MNSFSSLRLLFVLCCLFFTFTLATHHAFAQEPAASKEKAIYNQLKNFALTGGTVQVKSLVLKKDRAQIKLYVAVYLF